MSDPAQKPTWAFDIMDVFVTLFCILVLGLMFTGYLVNKHRHANSSAKICLSNLSLIAAAANQFALEHHLTNGMPINFPNDLTPYIKLTKDGKIPPCSKGGVYNIKKVGDVPTCLLGTTVTPAHVLPRAAERRQRVAHGVSRGFAKQTVQAPSGATEKILAQTKILSPHPGLLLFARFSPQLTLWAFI